MSARSAKELVKIIQSTHNKLRNSLKNGSHSASVWTEHCKNTAELKFYASAMHELASQHWEAKFQEDPNSSRIEWAYKSLMQYFTKGGLEKARAKEIKKIQFLVPHLLGKKNSTIPLDNETDETKQNESILGTHLYGTNLTLKEYINKSKDAGEHSKSSVMIGSENINSASFLLPRNDVSTLAVDHTSRHLGSAVPYATTAVSTDDATTVPTDATTTTTTTTTTVHTDAATTTITTTTTTTVSTAKTSNDTTATRTTTDDADANSSASGRLLQVLDVGSCYNPFSRFHNLQVTPIDLHPATQDVYQCDFLKVEIVNEDFVPGLTAENKIEFSKHNCGVNANVMNEAATIQEDKPNENITTSSVSDNGDVVNIKKCSETDNIFSSDNSHNGSKCGLKSDGSSNTISKDDGISLDGTEEVVDTDSSNVDKNKYSVNETTEIACKTFKVINTLPSNCFDVVVFCFFLSYLPSPEMRVQCCQKAYDMLKPEGILVIITPDSQYLHRNVRLYKYWHIALTALGFDRVKYEKNEHFHGMMFRKGICKNVYEHDSKRLFAKVKERNERILKEKSTIVNRSLVKQIKKIPLEDACRMLFIPADFYEEKKDDSEGEPSEMEDVEQACEESVNNTVKKRKLSEPNESENSFEQQQLQVESKRTKGAEEQVC